GDAQVEARALQLVAGQAGRRGVLALEGEARRRVGHDAKKRGVEAAHHMAGLALALVALGELAAVSILVAVVAPRKREPLEARLAGPLWLVAASAFGAHV